MKILVVRFSSIGDIVLTTPVIRALKVQLEDPEIHYCTSIQYREIVESNPYISRYLLFDQNLNSLIKEIRSEQYDFIVDLHHNFRTRLIQWSVSTKLYRFRKLNFQKWMMVNLKINQLPNKHIVDRYFESIKNLGVKPDAQGLDYFIPERDEVEVSWLPEPFRKGYVAFAIGARHRTKQLPLKRMIELCDKINKPTVLLGDKNDVVFGNAIESFFMKTEQSAQYDKGLEELNKKTLVFNACGKFNLNQTASLIKQASYVFTHDSGLMHIAAAFKKEIFSIWGNTIPLFGMYPYKTKFKIIENNKIHCRPCSKLGFTKCPKKHFKCMNDLVFDFYLT